MSQQMIQTNQNDRCRQQLESHLSKTLALFKAFQQACPQGKQTLREEDFKKFVQLGFKKECPDGMYGYLCDHFRQDPSIGIGWGVVVKMWHESNPPPRSRSLETNLEFDCHKSNHLSDYEILCSNKNILKVFITNKNVHINNKFNSNYKNILLIGGFFRQMIKDDHEGNLYSIDYLFKIIEKYYSQNVFLQCDEYDYDDDDPSKRKSVKNNKNINKNASTQLEKKLQGWSNFVIDKINEKNFNIKSIRAQTRWSRLSQINSNLIHFIGIVGIDKTARASANKKSFLDHVNFKYINSFGSDKKFDFKNKNDKNGNFETFLKLWLSVYCDIHFALELSQSSHDDLVYSMLVNTKQNTFVTRSTNILNEKTVIVNENDDITMFFENSNDDNYNYDSLKFYISTSDWMRKNGDKKEYYLDCLKLNQKYQYSIVIGYQAYSQIENLQNSKLPKIGVDLHVY